MNACLTRAIKDAIKENNNDEKSYVAIITRGKHLNSISEKPEDALYVQLFDPDGEQVASVPLDYMASTMLIRMKQFDGEEW